MQERKILSYEEQIARISKFDAAIVRAEELSTTVGDVIVEKKLANTPDEFYLTELKNLTPKVADVQKRLRSSTIRTLALQRDRAKIALKAGEDLELIRRGSESGVWSPQVLARAEQVYAKISGGAKEDTKTQNQPTQPEPIGQPQLMQVLTENKPTTIKNPHPISYDEKTKKFSIHGEEKKIEVKHLSELLRSLLQNTEGLPSQKVAEVIKKADKYETNLPSFYVNQLRALFSKWMPKEEVIKSHGGTRHAIYYLAQYEKLAVEEMSAQIPTTETSPLAENPAILEVLQVASADTKNLYHKFLAGDQAEHFSTVVREFKPKDEEEDTEFFRSFAGALFEEVGYLHLKEALAEKDTFILSPTDVVEVFRKLYPDRNTDPIFNLNSGVQGISLPDGLVIKDEGSSLTIKGLIEYKSSKDAPKGETFRKQLKNYTLDMFIRNFSSNNTPKNSNNSRSQIINEVRSDIPVKPLNIATDFKIIYGVPKNSTGNFPDGISVEYIPVDSTIHGRFLRAFRKAVAGDVQIPKQEKKAPIDKSLLAFQTTEVQQAMYRKIEDYFDSIAEFPNEMMATKLYERLEGIDIKGLDLKDVNLAIHNGVIKPRTQSGNILLNHRQMVELLLWHGSNRKLNHAQIAEFTELVDGIWKKRNQSSNSQE